MVLSKHANNNTFLIEFVVWFVLKGAAQCVIDRPSTLEILTNYLNVYEQSFVGLVARILLQVSILVQLNF